MARCFLLPRLGPALLRDVVLRLDGARLRDLPRDAILRLAGARPWGLRRDAALRSVEARLRGFLFESTDFRDFERPAMRFRVLIFRERDGRDACKSEQSAHSVGFFLRIVLRTRDVFRDRVVFLDRDVFRFRTGDETDVWRFVLLLRAGDDIDVDRSLFSDFEAVFSTDVGSFFTSIFLS